MTFPNGLKIKMAILELLLFIKIHYKRALPLTNTIILFVIMIIALEILSVTKDRLRNIQINTHDNNTELQRTTLFMKKAVTFGQIGEELKASKPVEWGY